MIANEKRIFTIITSLQFRICPPNTEQLFAEISKLDEQRSVYIRLVAVLNVLYEARPVDSENCWMLNYVEIVKELPLRKCDDS